MKLMIVLKEYGQNNYHTVEAPDESLESIRKSIVSFVADNLTWDDTEQCGCYCTSTSHPELLHVQEMDVVTPRIFPIAELFDYPIMDEQKLRDFGFPVSDCDENCTYLNHDYDD